MKDLASYVSLAIPSAFMVCLEYWSYEFLILMSGLLPNSKLETSMMAISLFFPYECLLMHIFDFNAICCNPSISKLQSFFPSFDTSSLVFRIPYGIGSAVSTRVSNELGAGQPRVAQLAVQVAIFLATAQGLFTSLILVSVRNIWGYLYTNEDEVVKYMASVIPVLVISNFMDGIQAALSGTARGCGWQKIGAFVNLGAYYLVGLPSAIILTFVLHFGGKDSLRGHVGPLLKTVYGVMSDRWSRGCGGAPRGRLRECAMSDLYMILYRALKSRALKRCARTLKRRAIKRRAQFIKRRAMKRRARLSASVKRRAMRVAASAI
ncbi:hypothetical protein HYC85_030576 [Camellia sinensis]|uniref:Protein DETOXIFICATION n=1 Tax=Camellia sinensis TaxID=4442 RepID=A0A7J7G280_CAMSI|nr:hypothetical protein HYC85_030576 [Camellia sinensis]